MRKSYKFRLYPAKEQEIVLVKTLDVCRYIYNEFLSDRRDAYDRCNQGLTTFDQITQVKYLEFNTEVFSQVKQDVLRRLGKSFDDHLMLFSEGAKRMKTQGIQGSKERTGTTVSHILNLVSRLKETD